MEAKGTTVELGLGGKMLAGMRKASGLTKGFTMADRGAATPAAVSSSGQSLCLSFSRQTEIQTPWEVSAVLLPGRSQ